MIYVRPTIQETNLLDSFIISNKTFLNVVYSGHLITEQIKYTFQYPIRLRLTSLRISENDFRRLYQTPSTRNCYRQGTLSSKPECLHGYNWSLHCFPFPSVKKRAQCGHLAHGEKASYSTVNTQISALMFRRCRVMKARWSSASNQARDVLKLLIAPFSLELNQSMNGKDAWSMRYSSSTL